MQSSENIERLQSFIDRAIHLDGQRDDDDRPFYVSVAAGDSVRGARTVVSGISVADKTTAELADEVRGAIWRNAGCRVYVVALGVEGEKSKRESVNLREAVEDDEGADVRAAGGATAALAGQIVRMAKAADERAYFVVQKNGQLMDQLLEVTRAKVLLEAREAYADELAALDSDRVWAEAFQTFASTAGQALVPLLASRMGAQGAVNVDGQEQPGDASEAFGELDQLLESFREWCERHPGQLAHPEGIARLSRLEAIAKANMAQPAQPATPPPAQPGT